jgi:DNA-binding response OmpR family regulator
MSQKILVVDDEIQIVRVVRSYLENANYQVLTASNGQDALFIAREEKPNLVVLDISMPKMDGLEFTRRIRSELPGIAIIMLTARVEEMDRILGLEIGADDYMTKPFSPRELVSRVRAVLRRGQSTSLSNQLLRIGEMTLDTVGRKVTLSGEPVELTPSEFELLAVMMQSPGRAFTRLDLLQAIQGVAFEAYERTVDVHIKNIRRKIEEDTGQPRYITTVRGVGYRLEDI